MHIKEEKRREAKSAISFFLSLPVAHQNATL
jgi:hypothetical protein